jgi:DNA-binding transcriptional ArsR family regulator
MDDRFFEEAAEVLKIMGHPLRLKIAQVLNQGEQTVGAIANAIGASQSATSQHLKIMKMKGILASRRDSTCVYYSVARPEVFKILRCIQDDNSLR